MIFFSFFQKTGFDISCQLSPKETFGMNCQILFSGKNKKNISKCCQLMILPRVLALKSNWWLIIIKVNEYTLTILSSLAGLGGSVGCSSFWWSGGCGFDPHRVGNILSWRFDNKIFSTVILSLLLFQEGQLSVSGKRMCTILVNCLED